MPTYEYRCTACQRRFEVTYRSIRTALEAPSPACPECGSDDTVRAVSSFAVSGGNAVANDSGQMPAAPAPRVTPREQIDSWRKS